MNYIIDDKEIIDIAAGRYTPTEIKKLIKSKQPVELIAEGEVVKDEEGFICDYYIEHLEGTKNITIKFYEICNKLIEYKSGKLYWVGEK
jgi:hypothetical protein